MKRKMKLPDAITTTTTTSMDLEYHYDDYCYGGGGASMGTWGRETQAPLHQELLGKREMKRKLGARGRCCATRGWTNHLLTIPDQAA